MPTHATMVLSDVCYRGPQKFLGCTSPHCFTSTTSETLVCFICSHQKRYSIALNARIRGFVCLLNSSSHEGGKKWESTSFSLKLWLCAWVRSFPTKENIQNGPIKEPYVRCIFDVKNIARDTIRWQIWRDEHCSRYHSLAGLRSRNESRSMTMTTIHKSTIWRIARTNFSYWVIFQT